MLAVFAPATACGQQQMQRGMQQFDPFDDRVPDHLRQGKVMSAQQGAAVRRGNHSNIRFG